MRLGERGGALWRCGIMDRSWVTASAADGRKEAQENQQREREDSRILGSGKRPSLML